MSSVPLKPLDLTSRRPPRVTTLTAEPVAATIDLARTALVVVDMQNDFLHDQGWFPSTGLDVSRLAALAPAIDRMAAAFREAGSRVVWLNWGVRADLANLPATVVHTGGLGGKRPTYGDPSPSGQGRILVTGEWGAGLIDGLTMQPSDLLVHKHRISGFFDSELDGVLRRQGIDTLVFCGINIDRCVFATLMDASFLGYGCILLEDLAETPSPDYVRASVLYLVRLLYGVTTTAALMNDALAASAGA